MANDLESRLAALSTDEQIEVLGRAIGGAVVDVVKGHGMQLAGLGQGATDLVANYAMKQIEPMLPALSVKLQEVSGPIIDKAVLQIRKELEDKAPLLALIMGVTTGALVVVGMWLFKRYG